MLARWARAPWGDTLANFLLVAPEECAALAPEPTPDRARMNAMIFAAETRGRRCVLAINAQWAKADLRLVLARGISATELAAEMLTHIAAGRDIAEPRDDLPGGQIAEQALRMALGACPMA